MGEDILEKHVCNIIFEMKRDFIMLLRIVIQYALSYPDKMKI